MAAVSRTWATTVIKSIADTNAHDLFAAVVGKKRVITDITVSNADAANSTLVDIIDEDAAVIWSSGAEINGGGWVNALKGILTQPTANKKIQVKCSAAGSVTISVIAYYI